MINIAKLKQDRKRFWGLVILVILLPLVIASVFVANRLQPRAESASKPNDIKTKRLTGNSFQISFSTDLPIKATVDFSIGITGAKFRCAEDATAETVHKISNNDLEPPVNLNPGLGYYAYINSGLEKPTLAYIAAQPDDPTFSLSFTSFSEDSLWLCRDDQGFDPALDVNQDGCVNLADMVELYPEK